MFIQPTRSNLIIAVVVIAAAGIYLMRVRATWRHIQAQGGVASLFKIDRPPNQRAHSSNADLAARVPAWIPIYPGTALKKISSHRAGLEHYFTVELTTADHCTKVVDWYQAKLEAAGYDIHGRFDYGDPGCSATVQSNGPGRKRSINVRAGSAVHDVTITVQSVERTGGEGATPVIPKWVPIYPGVTLPHLDASNSGNGEYHLSFSFTTVDDPTKVYSWYETKLKKLGFRVSFQTTPRSVGQLNSSGDDNQRLLNIRNFGTAPEHTFLVELMER